MQFVLFETNKGEYSIITFDYLCKKLFFVNKDKIKMRGKIFQTFITKQMKEYSFCLKMGHFLLETL